MYRYDNRLYDWIARMAGQDAEIILSYIVKWLKPSSVVDFGCGEGLWLNVVKRLDADICIRGIDGDYIDKNRLKIPIETFQIADLSKPLKMDTRFDLAISTEVGEHIDEQYSEQFIDNITNASDNVLFTAAIPGQGGINHVNEQWQGYWCEKFKRRGFSVNLSVRNFFWDNEKITSWRRQNLLFFSKDRNHIPSFPIELYDIVHPNSFTRLNERFIENDSQYSYCIQNLEICKQLDDAILQVTQKHKNIIIYPYGKNGKLCKKILNSKYGIQEWAIIDNYGYLTDDSILPVSVLGAQKDDFVVIDTCNNPQVHEEVLEELHGIVKSENIFTVFTDF